MPTTNKLKGLFVSFLGQPNNLYKVIDEKGKYVLIEEDSITYWER